jgi:hypothetical protein
MARTANTDLVQQGEAEATPVSRTRRVIIQRPYGNTDTHIHLGFNSYEAYVPFDEPVDLPADMVDYLRQQKRAEFHANEAGAPVASRSSLLAIVDA